MKKFIIGLLALQSLSNISKAQRNKIIVEVETDNIAANGKFALATMGIDQLEIAHDANREVFEEHVLNYKDGIYRACIKSDAPLNLVYYKSKLPIPMSRFFPLEPGDSIRIKVKGSDISFSGKGSGKLRFLHEVDISCNPKELTRLRRAVLDMHSLNDYYGYLNDFKSIYTIEENLLNKYAADFSRLSSLYFKSYFFNELRYYLLTKFSILLHYQPALNLSKADMVNIYDSTLKPYGPTALDRIDTANFAPVSLGLVKLAELECYRSNDFEINQNDLERRVSRYYFAKKMFTGLAQRKVLTDIVTSQMLRKSVVPETIAVTNDFLALENYPQYKSYVQYYMNKQAAYEKGKQAPAFTVTKTDGQSLSLSDLKGKIVFLDYWFTGCKGCVQMAEGLRQVEKEFEHNAKVEFLSVSIDDNKEQWKNSIAKSKYTTGSGTNVYTGGQGADHAIIKDYNVTAYPAVFLIDADGKFVQPVPDPRKDNGKGLIALIKKMLPPSPVDGPYVLFNGKGSIRKSIDLDVNGKPVSRSEKVESDVLLVNSDLAGKPFTVKLKGQLSIEPSIFKQPSKVLALSDIEGEFSAFRKLLQSNKVIDENFNWTFGDGHLVLMGDFFDRGLQVTEVLWLIYSLEEKAKAAGGYVHFVLGNHEIMNLNGDVRYVRQKYKDNAILLGESYSASLYGKNSELGRWLRTKNIIEKIGTGLYLHAGISPEINSAPLSIEEINNMVRPHYADADVLNKSGYLKTIMSTEVGPYWYRGYYGDYKKATQSQIDSTLKKFDVAKIVTGHTIISDGEQVTLHFEEKVINTDTHHAEEKSEALLIEANNYYRVNMEGEKVLLISNVISSTVYNKR